MSGGLRPAAGTADDKKLAGLIEPVVAAAGMDLESVRMTVAGKRRLLRVVVDSDHGVSLDDAADVSRDVSAALDAGGVLGEVPYTLEVSSPGVDRPLTQPRHWRRYDELGAGSVQVEFGRIPDAELSDFSDPERDDAVLADNTGNLGAGGDGH
jgi:ribosome maturation factor RimP